MKKLVIDLDNTLTMNDNNEYENKLPNMDIINKLIEYKKEGFYIIVNTSRNMRTFNGNLGLINAVTLPIVIDWLERYEIPYDEVHVGKPWCGFDGFYIDDRAIRPSEFKSMSYAEIRGLLEREVVR